MGVGKMTSYIEKPTEYKKNQIDGGRRGAIYGIMVEQEFAERTSGKRLGGIVKTDVICNGQKHSIKNTRKSSNVRFVAQSYNRIEDPIWKSYPEAREQGDLVAEKKACEHLIQQPNLLQYAIQGTREPAEYLTIYDNRTEKTNEDLTGVFRSFKIEDVLALYQDIQWKVSFGKKYYKIIGKLDGFRPACVTIELGSAKRKLLLVTFNNVQKQVDFWETKMTCRKIYGGG